LASKKVSQAQRQNQPDEHFNRVVDMLGRFLFHAPNWELGLYSAIDAFESVQDEAVECIIEPFEHVVSFSEELSQLGFWRNLSPSNWYTLFLSSSLTLLRVPECSCFRRACSNVWN
jgi:hypothetical protein